MNLQSIVVVALRLLALDFLFRSVLELSPKVFQLLQLYRRSWPTEPALETAFPWLLLAGLATGAILLWVFALPVARFVTKGAPQEVSLGTLTLADCYSVTFIGFGLYFIVGSFPQVLAWCHYLFKLAASTGGDSWKEQLTYEVAGVFIQFALGVLLFVKGRAWALALACRDKATESPTLPLGPSAADGGSKDSSTATAGGNRG